MSAPAMSEHSWALTQARYHARALAALLDELAEREAFGVLRILDFSASASASGASQ